MGREGRKVRTEGGNNGREGREGEPHLISSLLKEHVRADDEVTAGSGGALGEGGAAGHVRGIQHDGLVGEQSIGDHCGAFGGDGADDDTDILDVVELRHHL